MWMLAEKYRDQIRTQQNNRSIRNEPGRSSVSEKPKQTGKEKPGDNLSVSRMDRIEKLIFAGKTVEQITKALDIDDPDEVYDLIRAKANLIRERTVRLEIDIDLIKYKIIATLSKELDNPVGYVAVSAARTLLDYLMPKRDKTEGMVVINFGMAPPRMADSPTYVYTDDKGREIEGSITVDDTDQADQDETEQD